MLPLLQQLVLSLAVLVRRADVRSSCPSVCLSRRSIFNLGRYYLDAGPLVLVTGSYVAVHLLTFNLNTSDRSHTYIVIALNTTSKVSTSIGTAASDRC